VEIIAECIIKEEKNLFLEGCRYETSEFGQTVVDAVSAPLLDHLTNKRERFE